MTALGPGDWVECVDAAAHPGQDAHQRQNLRMIRKGHVYQVVGPATLGNGLFILGYQAAYEDLGWGWRRGRFRPIYRPKAEFIESLLQPAPELETA